MKLSDKVWEAAGAAGCEYKITATEELMERLTRGKTKNIAVLGETNCGKTSLINEMAGVQVRKPTKLPMEEEPLMVTFHSGETKPGYEQVDVQNSRCEEAGLTLFEIPMQMAVYSETEEVGAMLEEMDAVVYVISALMPLSAADVANIGILADKFPMVIYVSKADLLAGEEDYEEAMGYLREELSERFGGTACEIFDNRMPGAADAVTGRMAELALEEVREFHLLRLERQARQDVAAELTRKLTELDEEKRRREEERAGKDLAYRERLLKWEGLRVTMEEKARENMEAADKKISLEKPKAKERLVQELREAADKKKWLNQELRAALKEEMERRFLSVVEDVKDRAWADAAWLASEASRKLETKITVEELKAGLPEEPQTALGGVVKNSSSRKLAAAAGAGIVAGGSILGGMTLASVSFVAIPASLAAAYFFKEGLQDRKEYHEKLERSLDKCCEKNFDGLSSQVHRAIRNYYKAIAENIQRLGSDKPKTERDGSDIERQREGLEKLLEELGRPDRA